MRWRWCASKSGRAWLVLSAAVLWRWADAAPATVQELQELQQEVLALKSELQAPIPLPSNLDLSKLLSATGGAAPTAEQEQHPEQQPQQQQPQQQQQQLPLQQQQAQVQASQQALPAELPQFLRGPVGRPAAAAEPPLVEAQAPPLSMAATGSQQAVASQMAQAPVAVSPAPAAAAPSPAAAAIPAAAGESVGTSTSQSAAVDPAASTCTCEQEQAGPQCKLTKVIVHEDHSGTGMALADVSAVYGGNEPMLTDPQRAMVTLARVSETPFMCLDDRITKPSMATPGGDLGEFVLALASYYQERDPSGSTGVPTQEAVNSMLLKYVTMLPPSRPIVFCTDERAVAHLEAVLPAENLDLQSPPRHAMEAGLLEKMVDVESQGDSHFRLMLKRPEWYQLDDYLVPMVIKAFYSMLWKQQQDPNFVLYRSPRLKLEVLPRPEPSSPQAFLEVSSGNICHESGLAPLITPRDGVRNVLVSHLDAVSHRREELAAFFARVANATPLKLDKGRLHERLDRHGLLALEATGSRIAAGLPFYTLEYL
eukprot:TRINITY_DN112990_c0_g1_i1.p1 TRINITY_DN112990_c0_g1~~TRINITY_DN112990_c0_g1_i1.p1  ORF type:complete len:538 (+),score=137.27 TRINITY_DN112990_c0_g1_i1:132-1745(+)